ncbi:hypothetical protein M5D96_012071 [Drosophila gunungcola]|uniref:Uncharacterized protein n=1 Tax=Drosophila gunungcola TaxID=103775 RepID=A0A9P9YDU7_9MUSC|nr:hypothetical protein M5D96_012071 [Drosophila gunungcola]
MPPTKPVLAPTSPSSPSFALLPLSSEHFPRSPRSPPLANALRDPHFALGSRSGGIGRDR